MNYQASAGRIGTDRGTYYGKYRGKVINNVDPEGLGRIQVSVPEVRGANIADWAMPCSPYAGPDVGFFALPPIDASVWVEYEAGQMQYPIWSGCFWTSGDIPAADAIPTVMFLKTDQACIRIDNTLGEIKIEIGGASVTLTNSEIKIAAPQIQNDAGGAKTQLSAAGFDAQQGALKVL